MTGRLGAALLVVLEGFVTGALGALCFALWLGRKTRHPDALTRRADIYFRVGVVLFVGMTFWLLVAPWL